MIGYMPFRKASRYKRSGMLLAFGEGMYTAYRINGHIFLRYQECSHRLFLMYLAFMRVFQDAILASHPYPGAAVIGNENACSFEIS